ncbi:hypothetical protein PR202_gb11931 [Eleusine coracana subsp. coracana]|uniref:THH1/TOM1/TOM3 domain-containing protein n=1 Tax=Eleusine coracana subsp. coracana TaxID=191504 RepID=A0AAV5ENR6_ELECO|nr:hypothetical protein PR202_gb11931 [Eleusine coracana subsp. coracana]
MRKLASPSGLSLSSLEMLATAAGGLALSLRGWWEDVNESPAWQDGAFFSLSAAYAFVSAVALICIWLFLGINDNPLVELVSKVFISAVSFIALLGFLIYGGRLFSMLRRFPIESTGRRKKLYEVAFSSFDADLSLEVLDHPILDFFYYMPLYYSSCGNFLPSEYQHNTTLFTRMSWLPKSVPDAAASLSLLTAADPPPPHQRCACGPLPLLALVVWAPSHRRPSVRRLLLSLSTAPSSSPSTTDVDPLLHPRVPQRSPRRPPRLPRAPPHRAPSSSPSAAASGPLLVPERRRCRPPPPSPSASTVTTRAPLVLPRAPPHQAPSSSPSAEALGPSSSLSAVASGPLLVPESCRGPPPLSSGADLLDGLCLLFGKRCTLLFLPSPLLSDTLSPVDDQVSSSDNEGSNEHWEEPEDPHPPLPKECRLGSPDPDFVPQDEGPRRSAHRLFAVEAMTDEALEQQVEEVPAQVATHKCKRGQRSTNKAEGIYEVTALDLKDGEPIEPAAINAKWRNCCSKVSKLNCQYFKKNQTPFDKHGNISQQEWDEFVDQKTSSASMELSEKMVELNKRKKYKPRLGPGRYKMKIPIWREQEAKLHAEEKLDPLPNTNEHTRNSVHGRSDLTEEGVIIVKDSVTSEVVQALKGPIAMQTEAGLFTPEYHKDELGKAIGTKEHGGRVRGVSSSATGKQGFSETSSHLYKKHTLHKKEREDKAKKDWRRQLLMFAIDKESGRLDPNLQAAVDAVLRGSAGLDGQPHDDSLLTRRMAVFSLI